MVMDRSFKSTLSFLVKVDEHPKKTMQSQFDELFCDGTLEKSEKNFENRKIGKPLRGGKVIGLTSIEGN